VIRVRHPHRAIPFVFALAVASTCGCALLSRGSAVDVRWFTPDQAHAPVGNAEMQPGRELRLGRVISGSAVGLRIAFGDGLYEVGYYDSRRWTERPEHYVRRALDRALFEGGGFRRALTGDAPSLDVDVLEFQEVKVPTTHAARLTLHVVLSTDRVLLERTVTVSEPAAGDFEAFVAAMAIALEASTAEIARSVGAALDTGEPDVPHQALR
jgi:cholesterol transport system auxiliary component